MTIEMFAATAALVANLFFLLASIFTKDEGKSRHAIVLATVWLAVFWAACASNDAKHAKADAPKIEEVRK